MIEIIPAIDIMNGKCVRLEKGNFKRYVKYDRSPLEMAKWFEDLGVSRVHLVDLDGAKSASTRNLPVLENIRESTGLKRNKLTGCLMQEQIT